ncbi:uncharacterized protein ACLA_047800 [Aspergillus clavatus NRRL 1]|uniref:Uncharacterized protein n=1 Tax=Aspergillus clavatus (strain ATCC 1007 / CBS 513.65 / DSM 816 / NCTC 3887 / NRRL 1 / QM 1276 / 107) TaxID=344612 RepID=A1CHF6_ASPCL|nr:uncharacterized protein ACLA_047800 [Aspergillus clavatus NRRL 1]EAW10311.1 conserved hypothetical protein [Aspergillus clavatus NRRL 1]
MTSLFRKHNTPKPLHTRWGDVTISTPTDGAWNQYHNPHHPHKAYDYGPGFIPEHPPLAEPAPRPVSFSRRLSMRLSPRSRTSLAASASARRSDDCQPLLDRESHFAYRPIQQDYPREVEKAAAAATPSPSLNRPSSHRQSQTSPQFRYIPARTRYEEEFARTSPRSSCGSSSLAPSEDENRRFSLYAGQEGGACGNYESPRLSPDLGWMVGTAVPRRGSAGKKRFSTRRMTMTMVPDAEDIYG